MLHADSPDLMNAPDYVTNGEANSFVTFAPLYALAIHWGQLLLCVMCLGIPGAVTSGGGKRTVLLCIAAVAGLLSMWCAMYPWRSCSLPCVGPIRAAGFAVVAFGACLCYTRDTDLLSAGSHWRDQTLLFPVAGFLFFVGGAAGVLVQRRASNDWALVLQAAGLGDALESVASVGDTLLVAEALGGSQKGSRQRVEALLARAQECRSALDLGLLLVRFEEQILAERLRHHFLLSRDQWRKQLLGEGTSHEITAQGNGHVSAVTYDHVTQGAQALLGAIRPHAPLAVVNKHLVAMVFINHLPEYVAWEVFRFMYDVTPLVHVLQPMLLNTEKCNLYGATYTVALLQSAHNDERSLRNELIAALDTPAT